MLLVSVALHLGLATGVALSYLHWHQASAPALPQAKASTLILISSQTRMPEPQNLVHSAPAVSSVTPSLPKSSPTPSIPTPASSSVADIKSDPAPVVEANPNANIPLPKPEASLAPSPPPVLNGHDGVVFILDVSGSMYEPYAGSTRLSYARQMLTQQIRALKDGTPFAITLYALNAHRSGPLVAANPTTREAASRFILEDFDCGGGTNLPAGLASAQELHPGRIVLLSDGDLNTTETDLLSKAHELLGEPRSGPALTVLTIYPRPNTNAERLLQGLADLQNGNGRENHTIERTVLLKPVRNSATTP